MIGTQATQPIVFISYAHENDALSAAVRTLRGWLEERGCVVHTDHLYVDRPPPEGWQAWMIRCIREADVVLVVCTPKLKERYERNAAPGSGRGATFEGAIVTQHIYDSMMHNTKFYPVLPDGGHDDDIPVTLRPWSNGHRFPSGNARILNLVTSAPSGAEKVPIVASAGGTRLQDSGAAGPGAPSAAGAESMSSREPEVETRRPSARAQARLAFDLLSHTDAAPFLQHLCAEFDSAPQTAGGIVDHVLSTANAPSTSDATVRSLLIKTRRALKRVSLDAPERGASERCAVALYCLAACGLVNYAEPRGRLTLSVPLADDVVYGIIAAAIVGGKVILEPRVGRRGLAATGVFQVRLPGIGEVATDFERAAFLALFSLDRDGPGEALDPAGRLTHQQRADLRERLATLREVDELAVAFVVTGTAREDVGREFANAHRIPVLLPSKEVGRDILGMDVEVLIAGINEFLRELVHVVRTSSESHANDGGPTGGAAGSHG